MSFLNELKNKDSLKLQVDAFVLQHASHHRPVALVTSGGTVADLEFNSVRCIDNFSTGLRGAIAVEEFLRRGYAVIHLQRSGSASPFARVLHQYLERPPQYGLDADSLNRLFGHDEQEDIVKTVLKQEEKQEDSNSRVENEGISLNRGVMHSEKLRTALRDHETAVREGRILTINFRSVEDYLGSLQLCAESLRDCRSLAILYLAAAVSDFYIPISQRATHKIQSNTGSLTLELHPVPKVLGLLRKEWAPDAFCVSFKLETDEKILRQKAESAVEKYDVHMVIGNLLQTRHQQVSVLAPEDFDSLHPSDPSSWNMQILSRPNASDHDSLESILTDFVVHAHFEFLSYRFRGTSPKAIERAQQILREQKQRVQRELLWQKVKHVSLEVAGAAIALLISYTVNSTWQRRSSSTLY